MTKHFIKGDISFECDDCGDILETGTGNWDSAMNILRRNAWEARKHNDDWIHLCGCTKRKKWKEPRGTR